jgi:Fe-S-cluster containining protein
MSVKITGVNVSLPQAIEYGSGPKDPAIVCFQCGECCRKYQLRLSLIEARRAADELRLAFKDWVERYVERYWQRPESFLLRWANGACIFLEQAEGSKKNRCLIHQAKPLACWLWTPSLYRRECQEGLANYWGLTVSPFGQLEGTKEKLRDFYSFLNSLTFSNKVECKYVD